MQEQLVDSLFANLLQILVKFLHVYTCSIDKQILFLVIEIFAILSVYTINKYHFLSLHTQKSDIW